MKNYRLGIKKSPYDCRDYKYSKLKIAIELPEELDNSKYLLGIKDQGNQGSCGAHMGAYIKEGQEVKEWGLEDQLGAQKIYNLRGNYPEEGMYMRDVFKIMQKYGVIEERLFPYGKNTTSVPDNILYEGFKIDGYARIYTIEEMKQALYENCICGIAVPVYNFGLRMWKQNPGEYLLGGHALATCAYNIFLTGYNKEGFMIPNSWDSDWGINGYTILPYEDWPLVWEAWTAIDQKTIPPNPPDKKGWLIRLLQKIWNWIVNLFKKK